MLNPPAYGTITMPQYLCPTRQNLFFLKGCSKECERAFFSTLNDILAFFDTVTISVENRTNDQKLGNLKSDINI